MESKVGRVRTGKICVYSAIERGKRAEVAVNLRGVFYAGRRELERVDGPGEVRVPVDLAERQPLADRGLVDLDGKDACLGEVAHLVAERERELLALDLLRDVGARERPVQDRDRSRQHALHRALGQRLDMRRPAYRIGCQALHSLCICLDSELSRNATPLFSIPCVFFCSYATHVTLLSLRFCFVDCQKVQLSYSISSLLHVVRAVFLDRPDLRLFFLLLLMIFACAATSLC